MRKFIPFLAVSVVTAVGLLGCAGPINGKPTGGASLYSSVQFNEGTNDAPVGTKQGEGCATNILGLIATGDASAKSAATSAGISKVGAVDGSAMNILGLYSKYCVQVNGE